MKADGFLVAQGALARVELPIHLRHLATTPSVVLSAMACELFLKCLVLIETGKSSWGHDLKSLFDRLDESTRQTISLAWNLEVAARDKKIWDSIERQFGIQVPRDLPTALKASSKAFEDFRYSYEKDPGDLTYVLSDLPGILRRVALGRRPEWALLRPTVHEGQVDLPQNP